MRNFLKDYSFKNDREGRDFHRRKQGLISFDSSGASPTFHKLIHKRFPRFSSANKNEKKSKMKITKVTSSTSSNRYNVKLKLSLKTVKL